MKFAADPAPPDRRQGTYEATVMESRTSSRRKSAKKPADRPKVGVIMGSKSDWPTMKHAADILKALKVPHESKVVSAHRTPDRMFEYARSAADRKINVIIAGAGGAAHLPGMVASMTTLPVLGVPIESTALSGMDSLLSIAQMPGGIPVGTLAIGTSGAKNAGLLAASIIALSDPALSKRLTTWREKQTAAVPGSPAGR
jgi:5-(carboxyamino)imidazole ribonucleotide mutase